MWIELTDIDQQTIYVNMDQVTDFYDGQGDEPYAMIELATGQRTLRVAHTANDIMNLIVEEQRRVAALQQNVR